MTAIVLLVLQYGIFYAIGYRAGHNSCEKTYKEMLETREKKHEEELKKFSSKIETIKNILKEGK